MKMLPQLPGIHGFPGLRDGHPWVGAGLTSAWPLCLPVPRHGASPPTYPSPCRPARPTGISRSWPRPSRVKAAARPSRKSTPPGKFTKACRSCTVNGTPSPGHPDSCSQALRDIAEPRSRACARSQTLSQHGHAATCVSTQRREVRDMDRKCKSHSHNSCQERGEEWSENVYLQLAPSSA